MPAGLYHAVTAKCSGLWVAISMHNTGGPIWHRGVPPGRTPHPRHLAGLVGILWCAGVVQVATVTGPTQERPKEPDARAKEAQVDQPGGVRPGR